MSALLQTLLAALLKVGFLAVILNEVRGLVLAAPVIYGLYQSGGSAMAIWIAACSLAAIAASVVIPLFALRKAESYMARRRAALAAAG